MTRFYTGKELKSYRLIAADGALGSVDDFCVEHWNWMVRYLVVDTGEWLNNRTVLVSPVAVGNIHDQDKTIDIELTKCQLEQSPVVEQKQVISRHYEDLYYKHLNWAPYWTEAEIELQTQTTVGTESISEHHKNDSQYGGETSLKYQSELNGFEMSARGQKAGSIDGVIIDGYYWAIQYLIVDTQQWLSSKTVIIRPAWIIETDWENKIFKVDISHDVISSAPAYDESQPLSQQYEISLCKHYGMSYYGGKT